MWALMSLTLYLKKKPQPVDFQFRSQEFFRHITCLAFLFYSPWLVVLVLYLKLALVFNVD